METKNKIEDLLIDAEFPQGVLYTPQNLPIPIETALEGARYSVFYFGS